MKGAIIDMSVSVVVPTFNRGHGLAAMVTSLLRNSVAGVGSVEVIVVDDGSTIPAWHALEGCEPRLPFNLRCLRQSNRGAAAARNTGYRAAAGEVVIFIDDDIICPPNLIDSHVKAHLANPGCVIFGRCPFIVPEKATPLYQWISTLGLELCQSRTEEFIDSPIVASGQISVESSMFDKEAGVYRDELETPAAEEYELTFRLRERRIPILLATRIVAWHDHHVTLEGFCRQQYKHALGCAEVAMKYPATQSLLSLGNVIRTNRPCGSFREPLTLLTFGLKRLLALRVIRATILDAVGLAEQSRHLQVFLAPLYRMVVGLNFFAGVNDGVRKYARSVPEL